MKLTEDSWKSYFYSKAVTTTVAEVIFGDLDSFADNVSTGNDTSLLVMVTSGDEVPFGDIGTVMVTGFVFIFSIARNV
jgi:hypothetical protein